MRVAGLAHSAVRRTCPLVCVCLPVPFLWLHVFALDSMNSCRRKKRWNGPVQYEDPTKALMMLPTDMALVWCACACFLACVRSWVLKPGRCLPNRVTDPRAIAQFMAPDLLDLPQTCPSLLRRLLTRADLQTCHSAHRPPPLPPPTAGTASSSPWWTSTPRTRRRSSRHAALFGGRGQAPGCEGSMRRMQQAKWVVA